MEPTDHDLLCAYASGADPSAFDRLVERHTGCVFAAARRRLGGDGHLADDATQAVFLLLATKASGLAASDDRTLSAWLFHVMHFACARLHRSRSRQRRSEEQAETLLTGRSDRLSPGDGLLALLEDSIAQLPPADREAVVHRFYRGADLAAVGAALNVSADAARKRIGRALATVRLLMLRDGIDVIPDELLAAVGPPAPNDLPAARTVRVGGQVASLAKGTTVMLDQTRAVEFTTMSAEFFVRDVEANLDFFEKLGFRRRWTETPDGMGRIPRASVAGGAARVWLRRATDTEGTRPTPGVGLFFWIDGGPEALAAHRDAIVAQGVAAGPFCDDHTLRNFTVATPDGYTIGFYTAYR